MIISFSDDEISVIRKIPDREFITLVVNSDDNLFKQKKLNTRDNLPLTINRNNDSVVVLNLIATGLARLAHATF